MSDIVEIFHFHWERHPWNDVISGKLSGPEHRGLYQVYGTHPVYGSDTLLYIGQAVDQSFSKRLSSDNHWDFKDPPFSEFSFVCLGTLMPHDDAPGPKSKRDYEYIIHNSEQLLIRAHCPAYNAADIKTILDWDKDSFIVLNWGNYGRLLPEASSLRFGNKYLEHQKLSERRA